MEEKILQLLVGLTADMQEMKSDIGGLKTGVGSLKCDVSSLKTGLENDELAAKEFTVIKSRIFDLETKVNRAY